MASIKPWRIMVADVTSTLSVSNVKGRFLVRTLPHVLLARVTNQTTANNARNFNFVEVSGLKYSVFENSVSVNVTGVKCFGCLELAANDFCRRYNLQLEPGSVKADNSTVVGQLTGIDRGVLSRAASEWSSHNAPFVPIARTQWFPSLHLRPKKHYKSDEAGVPRLASCTVFPSGKIVILGAKSFKGAARTACEAGAFLGVDFFDSEEDELQLDGLARGCQRCTNVVAHDVPDSGTA